MPLLAAKLYDPATAVTKSTAAALAMTTLDTTNLRVTFTVPSNGMVLCRISCTVHGATTAPSLLVGVMSGSTVVARVSPALTWAGAQAATSLVAVESTFPVPGLTAGTATTWDAAYGVETAVASTAIKYGGPNDTTANNAYGAVIFEVWSTG